MGGRAFNILIDCIDWLNFKFSGQQEKISKFGINGKRFCFRLYYKCVNERKLTNRADLETVKMWLELKENLTFGGNELFEHNI